MTNPEGVFLICFAMAASIAPVHAQEYDLLLKGGHVIDPANKINGIRDVAVTGEKIGRVDANIPITEAKKVVDVSGLYVTPGLVDIHTSA